MNAEIDDMVREVMVKAPNDRRVFSGTGLCGLARA